LDDAVDDGDGGRRGLGFRRPNREKEGGDDAKRSVKGTHSFLLNRNAGRA
jgi:hypothetical protein